MNTLARIMFRRIPVRIKMYMPDRIRYSLINGLIPMPMDITTLNDATIVMIPPRFDAGNAPGIESELKAMLAAKPRKVIFDFSGTDYIASAGLRVLLLITRDLMKAGAKIALVELRPPVHKVFDMAGFTSIFLICVSREEALRKMG